jgi:hypothetical protein
MPNYALGQCDECWLSKGAFKSSTMLKPFFKPALNLLGYLVFAAVYLE